jgi:hypothetical protein
MYGNTLSIAPAVNTIYLYEAGSWAQGAYLRTNQGAGTPPLPTPGGLKVFNHSWGGSFGNSIVDNDALRRADYAIRRDSLVMIAGVNNSGANPPLMSANFNGISVGLTSGTHAFGPVAPAYDGAGRTKPEIVAPAQLTSFAAPLVDAVAELLISTARNAQWGGGLVNNPNAQRSEVVKAVILAGANHRAFWSNNPATTGATRGVTATPLDPVYGVDVVNVNRSHLILTGGEQDGTTTIPTSRNISHRGWDLAAIGPGTSRYYRYQVPATANEVSILATWHRVVPNGFASYTLADVNLTLWRLDNNGQLVTLVGNSGVPFFSAGNVVSQSAVDNVEHLYIKNLQPAHYVLEVSRIDGLAGNWDVAVAWLFPTPPIVGDVNNDGHVNIDDLFAVIGAWGNCPQPCPPTCPQDINGNCMVNIDDLFAVIANWAP